VCVVETRRASAYSERNRRQTHQYCGGNYQLQHGISFPIGQRNLRILILWRLAMSCKSAAQADGARRIAINTARLPELLGKGGRDEQQA
jgi:hypothetical protein